MPCAPSRTAVAEHVARVHRALRQRALRDALGPEEPPAHVEQHDVELLDRRVRDRAHELVDALRVEAPLARASAAPTRRAGRARTPRRAPTARASPSPSRRSSATLTHASCRTARLATASAPQTVSRSASDRAPGPSINSRSLTSFLAIPFSSEPGLSPRPLTHPRPGRAPPSAREQRDQSAPLIEAVRGGSNGRRACARARAVTDAGRPASPGAPWLARSSLAKRAEWRAHEFAPAGAAGAPCLLRRQPPFLCYSWSRGRQSRRPANSR